MSRFEKKKKYFDWFADILLAGIRAKINHDDSEIQVANIRRISYFGATSRK